MPVQQNQQQQPALPPDLLIKGNELLHLNNIIENMPTKFGFPLVQFFSQVSAMRNQETTAEQTKEKSKKDKSTNKE
jgi:hypothetical protein